MRIFDKETGGFKDKDFTEDFSINKADQFMKGDMSQTTYKPR